jgi:hypothetical protein
MHRRHDWYNISADSRFLPPMRLLACFALVIYAAAASAEVTCEQLGNIAFATQQMRDQGYSLPVVQDELDKLQTNNKFSAAEMTRIRDVADQAFKGGTRAPLEILQECKDKARR